MVDCPHSRDLSSPRLAYPTQRLPNPFPSYIPFSFLLPFLPHHDHDGPSWPRGRTQAPRLRQRVPDPFPCHPCGRRPTRAGRIPEGTAAALSRSSSGDCSCSPQVREQDEWEKSLKPSGKYYFTRSVPNPFVSVACPLLRSAIAIRVRSLRSPSLKDGSRARVSLSSRPMSTAPTFALVHPRTQDSCAHSSDR